MGTIYILSNPCYKHPSTNEPLYKIGMSSKPGEDRIKSLDSKTAVPMPFEIVTAFECEDPLKIEKCLHRVFDRDRINSDREFFTTDPDLVIDLLTAIGNLKISEKSDIDKMENTLGGIDSLDSTDKFLTVIDKYNAMVANDLKTAESCNRKERRITPFSDDRKKYFAYKMKDGFCFGFFYGMWIFNPDSSTIRDNVAEYLKSLDGQVFEKFAFRYEERGTNKSPYLSAICSYNNSTDGLNAFIKFIEHTKLAIESITETKSIGVKQ